MSNEYVTVIETTEYEHQPNEVLLTEGEVASQLRIKPHTLAVWRSTRRVVLPFVKIGKSVRYRPADVLAFLAASTKGVATATYVTA